MLGATAVSLITIYTPICLPGNHTRQRSYKQMKETRANLLTKGSDFQLKGFKKAELRLTLDPN